MRNDEKIAKRTPRLYITSNGVHVVAYDPKENDWYENRIDLLWKDFEFFTPLAGIEKIQFTGEAEADVKSAELMAKLFDDIRRYNDIRDPQTVHALNVFMSRLLFCFFAEDTGLFPEDNLFTNTLKTHTKDDGSDLGEFIDRAFFAMSTNDQAARSALPKLYQVFPYVNGGLFRDRYPIPTLSRRARALIINCGEYSWCEINPDIFGSMIQAVVTPVQRSGLGMHYTSVPNIEKVIRPLFLDALEEEFEVACVKARDMMAKNNDFAGAKKQLTDFLARLSRIKFFDPACGSGNFLIIAYKRLRELEIRTWKAIRDISRLSILPFPSITLTQFYGIEIDEYACDTATLLLWLAEHQMNVKFQEELNVCPETLPLKPSGHIVCGNACRLDWNAVCPHAPEDEVYIMGNPPYLGSRNQEDNHKEDLDFSISNLHNYRKLDYIAIWFCKAANYIKNTNSKSAFVTTNSVTQGEQVSSIWKYVSDLGIEIFFAYTSFKWVNNAKYNAAVTCAIIGLQNVSSTPKYLFTGGRKLIVEHINGYLSASPDIFIDGRSKSFNPFIPSIIYGSEPREGGNLMLTPSERDAIISDDEKFEKYIKKVMGSEEFINDIERYCIWVDDAEKEDAETSPFINHRFKAVSEYRVTSKRKDTQKYATTPNQFTNTTYKEATSILFPVISSERREYIPIGYVDKDTVILNSAFAIYDAEKWLFALLTSKMHNIWVRAVGGSLETRIRYSATLCYNTFPFPKMTRAEKEELERLAQKILDIREENFDMTLGEMYNPETMPEALREAHHELDLAVERIYRTEPFTSDEERLEHLFKLYAKMAKASK